MEKRVLELFNDKKFSELKDVLARINPPDLAIVFDELDKKDTLILFRLLPKELAADTFIEMESDTQQKLLEAFSDKEMKAVFDEIFIDDTVDIIEEMPATVVKRILKLADAETRKSINQILAYPEDSAGSIMTTEYVDLKKHLTVEQAFARIRKNGIDKETIYTCYVTDSRRKLIGVVTVRELLLSDYDNRIEDIMQTNVLFANTLDDRADVVQMFDKYDILALPIVDNESRLVGIVTVDDAIDVLQEEITEDIERMAAITPTDKPYLKTGVLEIFKSRIPWLLILMISATFTGLIINRFEDALVTFTALTAFIPMLMNTAGNAGSQASVTVIRGLSLGEIKFSDILKIVFKEFRVSLLAGAALSVANFIKIWAFDIGVLKSDITLLEAAVVCLTIFVSVLFSKMVGCALPILAKKLRLEPEVMASPFITTIVDVLVLLVYFTIAHLLLM